MTIAPEELESLEPQKTRTIDIEAFVDLDQIDPIYYDHPYLAPDKGAEAYKLLVDAMDEASKVAIARVVIRSESLVALRPRDGVLAMETMLFADEVINPDSLDELTVDGSKTSKRELDMAKQLIESLAADFEPEAIPRRVPRARARADRAQGGGRDDHDRGARGGADQGAGPDGGLEASIAASKARAVAARSARARRAAAPAAPSPPRRRPPPRSRPAAGRGRGRGPAALALEPGQGDVPRYRVHQGPGDRLLHAHRAGRAAAPARPPLTLKRYPNGVEGQYFYEKNCPSHAPEWVRKERVGEIDYCICDDLPTLVWLANLADLELHPSLSLAADMEHPSVMAFDLDPGLGRPARVLRGGDALREALGQLGLDSYAKTSGSKGIQVYVPLGSGEADYRGGTKLLSQALARHLEAQHPS